MSTYNILIVEDEPNVVNHYQHLLRGRSYRIESAANRAEAYQVIKRFRHDGNSRIDGASEVLALAILDQNLNDHDDDLYEPELADAGGISVIQEVKLACPLTRVVILTAYKLTESDRGFEAGRLHADDYLHKKDFDAEEFKAMVDHHLGAFDAARVEYNRRYAQEG